MLASWLSSKEVYRLRGVKNAVLPHREKHKTILIPVGGWGEGSLGTLGILQYDAVHYHSNDKHHIGLCI